MHHVFFTPLFPIFSQRLLCECKSTGDWPFSCEVGRIEMNIKKITKKNEQCDYTLCFFFLPLFSQRSSCELRWRWLWVGNMIVGVSGWIVEDHGVVMWQEKRGSAVTNCHICMMNGFKLRPVAVKTCTHMCGCRFWWEQVRVALENPRVAHGIP